MRMIDADDLLAKRPFAICGGDLSEYDEGYLDAIADAVEAVKHAPVIDPESLRPRWIPVTERMPVEAKKVLCFLALSGGPMVETGYYMGGEGWYYTGIEAPHHGIVTHWMPLPAPPTKEE